RGEGGPPARGPALFAEHARDRGAEPARPARRRPPARRAPARTPACGWGAGGARADARRLGSRAGLHLAEQPARTTGGVAIRAPPRPGRTRRLARDRRPRSTALRAAGGAARPDAGGTGGTGDSAGQDSGRSRAPVVATGIAARP